MIIGMDIDGVLADFDPSYQMELNRIQRISIPYKTPHKWHFEEEMGFSSRTVEEFWRTMGQHPDFWFGLPMLATADDVAVLREAMLRDTVYAISKRPLHVQKMTQLWLVRHEFVATASEIPMAAILTNQKGLTAKALELDAMFDDKPQNLEQIFNEYPKCKRFLVDRPWNRDYETGDIGAIRIYRLREGFDILYKGDV